MSVRLAPSKINRLENEFGILHLIYHRNYNQHRVAVWWKLLDMIHRNVRKILFKLRSIDDTKKILMKERLHREAVAVARYMIKKGVFKKASYDFNSIIALGQFVTLGMVLVASLSAIYSLVSELHDAASVRVEEPKARKPTKVEAFTDLGEEINEDLLKLPFVVNESLNFALDDPKRELRYDSLKEKKYKVTELKKSENKNLMREKTKNKNQKRDKKKKRNAIDDIFG